MSQPVQDQPSLQDQLLDLKANYSEALSKDQALEFAIQAAELHLKFLRLATNKSDRLDLGKKCKSLLDDAERLKTSDVWDPSDELLLQLNPPLEPARLTTSTSSITESLREGRTPVVEVVPGTLLTNRPTLKVLPEPISSRELPRNEQIILLKSSKINGRTFQPWSNTLISEHFQPKSSEKLYRDASEFSMSPEQLAIFNEWKRASDALPPPLWPVDVTFPSARGINAYNRFMKASQKVDLVQDATTDCSVVASLCAGVARMERGFAEILTTAIHPFDVVEGHPQVSPNGKYIVRLNFNGCSRAVIIDDRLPVSKTSRVLHVVDRQNPSLLWPALLEKAYLKVRGGYDFPGSNSGTDLWILTGWIPEQIFLQRDETNAERLWARMKKAFGYGDVLITMGTGMMTSRTERDLGLAGEHDYAVIDLDESKNRRRLQIKNPWLKATAWRNYHLRGSSLTDRSPHDRLEVEEEEWASAPSFVSATEHDNQTPRNESSMEKSESDLNPGTFWMDMNDIMQNFESIYLNWNPGLFRFRQDIHFNWNLSFDECNGRSPPGSLLNNPQYAVKCNKGSTTWFLLCKHFTDKQKENANREHQGYLSLYVFANQGRRVLSSKSAIKQGPYVDSPQTLLILEPSPDVTDYTVVLSEQDLPPSLHTFTLSAFSCSAVSLSPAVSRSPHHCTIRSSWTQSSAGGNAGSSTYTQNPQFSLTLTRSTAVNLILETLAPGLSVHVKLLHGQGQRVFSVIGRDVVVDSGDYRRGCAIAETKAPLDAGTYTVICSTFDAGKLGDFTLSVDSNCKATLKMIAKEGAGRIRTHLADASFGAGVRVVAAPIYPHRLARMYLTAKYVAALAASKMHAGELGSRNSPHSPIRLTIELGVGPNRQILISSGKGMFDDSPSGVRTEDVNLQPDMAKERDIWLVLERLGGFDGVGRVEERIAVEMWADVENAIDFGVWRVWEK